MIPIFTFKVNLLLTLASFNINYLIRISMTIEYYYISSGWPGTLEFRHSVVIIVHTTTSSTFFVEAGVLPTICLGWCQIAILLISTPSTPPS
jgi:hypothetical protein